MILSGHILSGSSYKAYHITIALLIAICLTSLDHTLYPSRLKYLTQQLLFLLNLVIILRLKRQEISYPSGPSVQESHRRTTQKHFSTSRAVSDNSIVLQIQPMRFQENPAIVLNSQHPTAPVHPNNM